MRNLKFFGFIIFIGIYSSCSKNDDKNGLLLNGIYTESAPYSGTHQLNFVDHNTLVVKGRNSTDEEFIYELDDNIIKLTPIRDLTQTWDLEINIINDFEFEITNIFYASIPEEDDAVRFVTFEK